MRLYVLRACCGTARVRVRPRCCAGDVAGCGRWRRTWKGGRSFPSGSTRPMGSAALRSRACRRTPRRPRTIGIDQLDRLAERQGCGGRGEMTTTGGPEHHQLERWRLNTNGTLDTSFGSSGMQTIPTSSGGVTYTVDSAPKTSRSSPAGRSTSWRSSSLPAQPAPRSSWSPSSRQRRPRHVVRHLRDRVVQLRHEVFGVDEPSAVWPSGLTGRSSSPPPYSRLPAAATCSGSPG